MTSQQSIASREAISQSWPAPLSLAAWDRRFPGMLDTVSAMAGMANVILQLSHPAVGYGVKESRVESGSILKHPRKRSRTTFTYLTVAMTGSTEEKLAYRKAVSRVHAEVYSTETSPVSYRALDPDLQMWVAACLYFGFVDAHRKLRGGLSRDDEAVFYRLAQPLGTTLQVRPGMWPATPEAFAQYWQDGLARVRIDDTVREFLTTLAGLGFAGPVVRFLFGRFHRFVTAGFLPAPLRAQMHFAWSDRDQRRFERLLKGISLINRCLPRPLRQLHFVLYGRDFRQRLREGRPLV